MLKLQEFGVYTFPEKKRQESVSCWFLVNLGELKSVSATLPSGRHLFELTKGEPFALLLPVGGCFDFDYGTKREDWVVELPAGSMTESDEGSILLSWPGMQAEVPAFLRLDATQTERARGHLTRMLEAFHNPESGAALSLQLSFYALLDCILNPDQSLDAEDPAEALRKRIIADRGFVMHLSALSEACGYSADHLRRLFETRFGTSPKAFRTEYRMRLAQDLLRLRGLSVQEVATELGYGHAAHFSSAFKKHVGQSPKAWKEQYGAIN